MSITTYEEPATVRELLESIAERTAALAALPDRALAVAYDDLRDINYGLADAVGWIGECTAIPAHPETAAESHAADQRADAAADQL